MSTNRKWLKITSLVQVVLAIWALILGFIAITGVDNGVTEAEIGLFGMAWVFLEGILLICGGALTLFCAILGIHGANRPSRLGAHRLLAILALLFGAVSAYMGGAGQTLPLCDALLVVAALAAAVLDTLCRKELER